MIVINRCYAYGGSGIFNSLANFIASEVAKKAATEDTKKVVEGTAKKVGDVAGEKVVSGISRLPKKTKKPTVLLERNTNISELSEQSRNILNRLTQQPKHKNPASISNILEGAGQAIAIEKHARQLNKPYNK